MTQLEVPNSEMYTVSYENGFPSFSIYTVTSGSWLEPANMTGVYNDKTYFDFHFHVRVNEAGKEKLIEIDAIDCKEAIGRVADEDQRKKMLKNFGELADNFVCPDLTSYSLYTPDWIQLDI